ncbi:MAG TPA: ribonuclease HI [Burkholderiales bacterium]|jgi:ribonuclease HI|nr:ribonuclease HI [Burkholderiales bacterium]
MQQTKLIIYTDGACKGNPGIGGWGAILMYGDKVKEIYGYAPETTNNRMELSAVIEALKVIKRSCPITIFTDSQYVKRGITEWIDGWIKKNWKNVKNVDLWQELYPLSKQYDIDWQWVRGHNGDKYNERADELANLAITLAQQNA